MITARCRIINHPGRGGKPRCEHCRRSKKMCAYDSPESKCTRCVQKGIECTLKISADRFRSEQARLQRVSNLAVGSGTAVSIPRLLVGADTQRLPEFELKHLRAFHSRKFLFAFLLLQEFRADGRHFQGVVTRRFGRYLDSKVVRYGMIISSLLKADDAEMHQLAYLEQFYHAISDSVGREDYAELVYGCFLACLYTIRTGAPLAEPVAYAHAFRLSARQIQSSTVLSTEECLLLWCMWEKILWNMSRKYVFNNTNPTAQLTNDFFDLTGPFLSPDPNWRSWMLESYVEVNSKLRFIGFAVRLGQHATTESLLVKASITRRFQRAWKRKSHSNDRPVTVTESLILRKLSDTLWSNLITLLEQVLFDATSTSACENVVQTIRTILSVVAQRPPQEHPGALNPRVERFLDAAVYALVLVGLLLCEWHETFPICDAPPDLALLNSLFDATRCHLRLTLGDLGNSEDPTILTLFNEAALNCSLPDSSTPLRQFTAVTEWIRICG